MIPYKKHQIIRIKDLNDSFFEILFQKRDLNFVPGCAVTLYKCSDYPIFIASGIQESWTRLILRKDIFYSNFKPDTTSIKLNLEVKNLLPTLMAEETPSFVFDTQTIGAFFSWVSTYPNNNCKVCYIGNDKVQESWISSNHTIIKASDVLKMKKMSNLYVSGDRDFFNGKGRKLLNNSNGSFIIG